MTCNVLTSVEGRDGSDKWITDISQEEDVSDFRPTFLIAFSAEFTSQAKPYYDHARRENRCVIDFLLWYIDVCSMNALSGTCLDAVIQTEMLIAKLRLQLKITSGSEYCVCLSSMS